jgi:hypothetical protein
MRIRTSSVSAGSLIFWAIHALFANPLVAQSVPAWQLPQRLSVKDTGPRTYRFVVEYTTTTPQGISCAAND